MEISEVILSEAHIISFIVSSNDELDLLLKNFETKTVEEFLDGETTPEIRKIDIHIHSFHSRFFYVPESERVKYLATIINSIKYYLIKGISNANVIDVLIFLSVNSYFKFNVKDIISKSKLQKTNYKLTAESIQNILSRLKLQITAGKDAPYYEKKLLDDYKNGFAEVNINKTYAFIESFERSGRGFHFNYLVENLIEFLYEISFHYFLKSLDTLSDPQSYIFYLQGLSKRKLLKLANEKTIINKWLNFEILRQIIENEKTNSIKSNEVDAINKLFIRIFNEDFNFLKQTINYFSKSFLFNSSLGKSLTILSEAQLSEIINDCFKINSDTNNFEIKKYFLKTFAKSATNDQMNLLLNKIYSKFEILFIELMNSDDYYLNDLFLSDYAHFIIRYYSYMSDDELIESISKTMNKILFLDSEFSISYSQQLSRFHLYHSQLYLQSFAFRNKRLNNNELILLLSMIKENKIHKKRFFSNSHEQYKTISRNLKKANTYS